MSLQNVLLQVFHFLKVLVSHEEVKFICAVKFNQDSVKALLDSKGQEDSVTITLLLSNLWGIHRL